MTACALYEALQQIAAGGLAGVKQDGKVPFCKPGKNLMQIVPACVAHHLRIVPAVGKEPAAEKGFCDINSADANFRPQGIKIPLHVAAQ